MVTSPGHEVKPSLFTNKRGKLFLSSQQLEQLMRGVLDKGAPFRFQGKGFSMSPFIKDGDILTIGPIQRCAPSFGDVVVFTNPHNGRLIIHRIIGKKAGSYLTKGDNAPEEDGLISREAIVGLVTSVERDGKKLFLGLGPDRFIIAFVTRNGLLSLLNLLWRLVRFFIRSRSGE
jgi:phage repressor protein C with HTH and peptisase S24 domain